MFLIIKNIVSKSSQNDMHREYDMFPDICLDVYGGIAAEAHMTFASVSHSGMQKVDALPYNKPYVIDQRSGSIR
jgi:hypothetical protein